MNISIIAGARPNFIKIAPIIHSIVEARNAGRDISYRLVHTGQHYDQKMSDTFFEQLDIPHPDNNLGCGGGTQAEQTAAILIEYEKELLNNPADLVLVVGDVTSTMACAIVAKKLNTKVAHVEAGIRSFDLSMPEEINRMVTDSITDYFFTTSSYANDNLIKNGVERENIFFVGNVMIDTLHRNRPFFTKPYFFDEIGLVPRDYFVMTLHRPANVDQSANLKDLIFEITNNARGLPIVFPIHPRTAKVFTSLGINQNNLFIVDPLGYHEFNYLVEHSKGVITDSGGITEETTVMGIPCFTLRNNTERPETVAIGTNVLVGTDPKNIKPVLDSLFSGQFKKGGIPPLWDGKAAERLVNNILALYEK
jgi:UDP-N-acetylglucosamine 2-epimerase (non-hydrolysing)